MQKFIVKLKNRNHIFCLAGGLVEEASFWLNLRTIRRALEASNFLTFVLCFVSSLLSFIFTWGVDFSFYFSNSLLSITRRIALLRLFSSLKLFHFSKQNLMYTYRNKARKVRVTKKHVRIRALTKMSPNSYLLVWGLITLKDSRTKNKSNIEKNTKYKVYRRKTKQLRNSLRIFILNEAKNKSVRNRITICLL